MAIQPLDLQILFSQLDKVGKDQATQKEGAQMQAALQGMHIQKKTDEHFHAVNELQDIGKEAERIKDKNARQQQQGGSAAQEDGDGETRESDGETAVIRDPALGKNIDVSG
ncbi:MAG: hypothetical protein LBD37_03775 [Treponema sp.]|jgi:hypothetical protein|nr:hypothetical protein [Treponema sp.]